MIYFRGLGLVVSILQKKLKRVKGPKPLCLIEVQFFHDPFQCRIDVGISRVLVNVRTDPSRGNRQPKQIPPQTLFHILFVEVDVVTFPFVFDECAMFIHQRNRELVLNCILDECVMLRGDFHLVLSGEGKAPKGSCLAGTEFLGNFIQGAPILRWAFSIPRECHPATGFSIYAVDRGMNTSASVTSARAIGVLFRFDVVEVFHLVLSEDEQFVFGNQLHRVAVEVLSVLEVGRNSVENSADVLAHSFVFRPCTDLRVRHPGANSAGRRGRLCFVTSRHHRCVFVIPDEHAVGSIGRLHDSLSGLGYAFSIP